MTQPGRDILLRVEIRCAEQWGVALSEMENTYDQLAKKSRGTTLMNGAAEPFGAIAWHDAIRIVHDLRMNGKAA